MNTHTLCFCLLIIKLLAFENLKWTLEKSTEKAEEIQIHLGLYIVYIIEIQLIFSHVKYSFLYFHM